MKTANILKITAAIAVFVLILFFVKKPVSTAESNNLLVWLNNPDANKIAASNFTNVIMDYSTYDKGVVIFSRDQISRLKRTPDGKKRLVLCYLSIGEAENYRSYWQSRWQPDPDPPHWRGCPVWLGPVNPGWAGNFLVQYWNEGWQQNIYKYINTIIDQNFDGLYLDVVDAYVRIQSPPYNIKSGRAKMEQFVINISRYAKSRKHDMKIFPQNAEEFATLQDSATPNTAYINAIDGIGREGLFWCNGRRKDSDIKNEAKYLDVFKNAGKTVFTIDYPPQSDKESIKWVRLEAAKRGYIEYCGTRELNGIVMQH